MSLVPTQFPTITTFTPASACTNDIYWYFDCATWPNGESDCGKLHLARSTTAADCFPTGWSPDEGAFMSPGSCPKGYTAACGNYAAGEPETTATCCPSGFSCQTSSDEPWYSTELCYRDLPIKRSYIFTEDWTDMVNVYTTYNPELTGPRPRVNAYGMVIKWQDTDITVPVTETATTTPASTTDEIESKTPHVVNGTTKSSYTSTADSHTTKAGHGSATETPSAATASTEIPSEVPDSSGLSRSANAGVSFGGALAVLLVLLAS